jgi:fumarylacetoacetate (FAA) hydrolase
MKLATLMDGSRNGQLAVVSRDLTQAHFATGIATTMQQLLDDWNFVSPQLEDLSATLNGGKARHAFPFDPARCLAPLPRPVAWLRGEGAGQDARLEAAAGGALAGARLPLVADTGAPPFVLQPQLAVVCGDLPRGADAEAAREAVRLLLLAAEAPQPAATDSVDAWRLHTHAHAAFGPVAVTPDELGEAWRRGRLDGLLRVQRAGREAWRGEAAQAGDAGRWLAAAARRRPLVAGTLLALAVPAAAQDGAGGAETPSMQLSLAPGDHLVLGLDTAAADAPLGRITLSVDAPESPVPEAAA